MKKFTDIGQAQRDYDLRTDALAGTEPIHDLPLDVDAVERQIDNARTWRERDI
jgi:hypothetical protein